MRKLWLAAPLVAALSGCSSVFAPFDDLECRHVLSPAGQPLRFCESNGLLTVDNHPARAPDPSDARLIDDPKFLKGMIAQLPRTHAKPVASPVRPSPPGYITIAESDFINLVRMSWFRWPSSDPHAADSKSP